MSHVFLFLVLVSAVLVMSRLSFLPFSSKTISGSPGYCFSSRFGLRVMFLDSWNLNHLSLSFVQSLVYLLTNVIDRNIPSANYSLKYNVMPYVGVLTYGEAARTKEPVAFPESRDLS